MALTTTRLLEVVGRAPHTFGSHLTSWLEAEIAGLGASDEEVITAAGAAMSSDDRNVRVKALRVLGLYDDPRATEGLLQGLRDPARRVREVAIKCSRRHHGSAEVLDELRRIASDEDQTDRLRRNAFHELSTSASRTPLPDVAQDALAGFMDSDRFRGPVLRRLCSSPTQTPASRAVLHEFVRTGSKEEAVMATRALAGHMLVRVDGWLPPEQRRRLRETYDPATAEGDAYWLPVADAVALAKAMGIV